MADFSFTTTAGHTTHISILWVFVLFSFLCVAIVLLGGQQKGLAEREMTDGQFHGNLKVDGRLDANHDIRVLGLTETAVQLTREDRFKTIVMNDSENRVITLPTDPENGDTFLINANYTTLASGGDTVGTSVVTTALHTWGASAAAVGVSPGDVSISTATGGNTNFIPNNASGDRVDGWTLGCEYDGASWRTYTGVVYINKTHASDSYDFWS